MNSGEMMAVVIFLGIPWILGSAFKAQLNHQRFMKILQLKSEMNARLLERVGTEPAVLDLLKSEAQQQMFDVKMPELLPAPYMRMLTSVQFSVLLLSVGGAFLYMQRGPGERGDEALLFFGTLGIALGIGAFFSAIAAFVVGRIWHTAKDAG